MKRAILSDIHSNLEALQAVLKDITDQGVEEIYCLGDLVGYGPNPVECVDIIMDEPRQKVCIMGNHDQAALVDPHGFNPAAENAIRWTRSQLDNTKDPRYEERWGFLSLIPQIVRKGDFMYVHGSPRIPLSEYVFCEDTMEEEKMEKLFGIVRKYCFQGHTHVPVIFTEKKEFVRPQDLDHGIFTLGDEKLMINVGSVGQPRDKDPRACYVIYDTDKNQIEYRRVEYDTKTTREKILAIPELDNFLGNRILEGR